MDNSPPLSNDEAELLKSFEIEEKKNTELGQINQNLVALQEFGEAALIHWNENNQRTAETERKQMELEDKIHARNIRLAVIALVGFFIIVITALFLGFTSTADTIIDSLFKFLAGAGIVGYFARKQNKDS